MILEKYRLGPFTVAVAIIPRCLLRCWRISKTGAKGNTVSIGGLMHPPTIEMCQALQSLYLANKPG